jgi:hypothetical protein
MAKSHRSTYEIFSSNNHHDNLSNIQGQNTESTYTSFAKEISFHSSTDKDKFYKSIRIRNILFLVEKSPAKINCLLVCPHSTD